MKGNRTAAARHLTWHNMRYRASEMVELSMSQPLINYLRRRPDLQCGKTARVTKYGSPCKLICQQAEGHRGQCRDVDNGLWFEPDTERR